MPNSEKRKELTRQIIIRIKEVIKDMPDAEVLQRMLDAGEQTSISTIRRIKAEGSEDTGFNYDLTIKPFARVFLGLNDKPVDIEALDTEEEKDRAALKNMIQLKNFQIESLEAQIESLEAQIADMKGGEERKIAHLRGQIEGLNKIIDDRKEFMADYRERIVHLEKEKDELRTRYEAELAAQKRVSRWITVAFGFACFLALVLEPLIPLFR